MLWTKLSIGLLLTMFSSQLIYAAPFIPTDDLQILETLPTDSPSPRYSSVSDLTATTTLNSADNAKQLLERAYLEGDPRALGQARAQLDQSEDQSIETLMLRARALQSDHRFTQAKEILAQILNQDPAHPDALLTLSSLLVVQGQFDEAMDYCDQLNDPSLEVYQAACIAQIQSMTGKLSQAKQTLNSLASLAPRLDASTALWIYLIQADAALRSSDTALANQVFAVIDDQTVPALMARADWLLSIGKYQQVIDLLQNHTDKDALLLRLIEAQMKMGDPKADANLALMKERIDVWQLRGEKAHTREQAMYALLAKQNDDALNLAQDNWQEQRETADIVLYTTAAIKADSQKDIKIIRQFISDTQFEYPTLERALILGKIEECLNCTATQAMNKDKS